MPFPYTLPFLFARPIRVTPDAVSRELKSLLPPGKAWNLEASSWITKVLLALGEELSRVYARAYDLLAESDPRTAVETLEDWERMLALPDSAILTIPTTRTDRQLAISQKLANRGGSSRDYFRALGTDCGYSVTVTDGRSSEVLRAGTGRAGDRVQGLTWAFHWTVTVSPPVGPALTHAELEAIFNRAKPAHTTIDFVYL